MIKEKAIETLQIEADAVKKLINHIDDEFETIKIRCAHLTVQLVDRQDRDMRIRSTFPITEVALRSYALTQFLCGGILLFKFKNAKDCEETSW